MHQADYTISFCEFRHREIHIHRLPKNHILHWCAKQRHTYMYGGYPTIKRKLSEGDIIT